MRSCNVKSNRRGPFIAACLIGALVAQAASADCPPGYRNKAGHCIPGPVQTHHPVAIESSVHAPTAYTSHSKHSGGPAPGASTSGYDLRAQHEARSSHGIIFVGGKQALNPQPIPPGHAVKTLPHPGVPIENAAGH